MSNNKEIAFGIILLIILYILLRTIYTYFKTKPYKKIMNKFNDDSEILYWNNHNILLSDKYVYINKNKYDYEDISKVTIKHNFFNTFKIIRIFGILKPIPVTTYHICLKNKINVKADDLLNYYKGDYVSIKDIIKNKNNKINIIVL